MYSREQLKEILEKLVDEHPNSYSRLVRSQTYDPEILKSILNQIPEFLDRYSLPTKVYWIIHDLKNFPKCANEKCSNTLEGHNVRNARSGFSLTCCPECGHECKHREELYKKTCLKNLGVDNASKSLTVKDLKTLTSFKNFGTDNPAKAEQVKKKKADTNLEKYGETTYLHSEEGREVVTKTCLERYSVSSYSKTDEFIEKMKSSNNEKFGVDFPMQDPEFRKSASAKYTYDGNNFDSAAELAMFIWLKDNDIDFTYHPDVSFKYVYAEIEHIYLPDFIIEDQLVEVKGDHFFEDRDPSKRMINPYDRSQDELYEAKHKCMTKNNVKILTSQDYTQYIDYVRSEYGEDFLKRCKRKSED